jgi:hypothetical protein
MRSRLTRELKGEKWKIITLVRDPVARSISDFFQNSEFERQPNDNVWYVKSKWYDYEITVSENNVKPLIEVYHRIYDHWRPLNYFDHEFKGVLGINIFEKPFSHSAGYKIYEFDKYKILLMKLEHLNECFHEAAGQFLEVDTCTPIDTNVGEQKKYAQLYQIVKKQIKFPEKLLDEIYSYKFPRHFYSIDEIEVLKKRWTGGGEPQSLNHLRNKLTYSQKLTKIKKASGC